jgi:hypothetical protein
MKIYYSIISSLIVLTFISCDIENIIDDMQDGKITAKEKLEEVMNKAKSDFAQDALLASIYGREVSTSGEVDLLNTDSFNAFVYVVQSNSLQANELYIPVFGLEPIESPINFETMLSFIKDSSAKDIMGTVLGTLAGVAIDPSANYSDSPEVLSLLLARDDVINFRTANQNSKIDMFLIPGKSIDSTSIINSADWIVNFYGDNSSLVLWLHPGNSAGTIDLLSD